MKTFHVVNAFYAVAYEGWGKRGKGGKKREGKNGGKNRRLRCGAMTRSFWEGGRYTNTVERTIESAHRRDHFFEVDVTDNRREKIVG